MFLLPLSNSLGQLLSQFLFLSLQSLNFELSNLLFQLIDLIIFQLVDILLHLFLVQFPQLLGFFLHLLPHILHFLRLPLLFLLHLPRQPLNLPIPVDSHLLVVGVITAVLEFRSLPGAISTKLPVISEIGHLPFASNILGSLWMMHIR